MRHDQPKSRSRSSHYQQTLASPKEILNELLKIDDQQIFQKEFDQMKGLVKILKSEHNQTIAIAEFLKQKLEEVESQISIAKSLITNKDLAWASLIDINKLEETKNFIKNEIKFISSKSSKSLYDFEMNFFSHSQSENNTYNSRKILLRLNVIYHDGSDLQPQVVNLEIDPEISFLEFLKKLKETLEIYEFSTLKLVLINEKKEEKFISKISEFSKDAENFVKIVPKDYKINVHSKN